MVIVVRAVCFSGFSKKITGIMPAQQNQGVDARRVTPQPCCACAHSTSTREKQTPPTGGVSYD
jgi:hypothetical protein